jgi:hypothetical protein
MIMSELSVFPDKAMVPADKDVKEKLGPKYELWKRIHDFVLDKYPDGICEWNFPGKKYGWSYRIKDNKRAIIYFLPRDRYFLVAFVFGDKAVKEVMGSSISYKIKEDLNNARKYAEGRGVRIDINDETILPDIERLIEIKLNN